MYQLPVQNPESIRTSRKRVKQILTDIGLDSCQDLWKEMKSFDAGDLGYNTEWEDLTDSYHPKRRRKWWYRAERLCCSLCWFATRSFYSFKNHVQRCHEEESKLASLSPCSYCPYVSQPALVNRHVKMFHTQAPRGAAAAAGTDKNGSGNTNNSQVGERVYKPGVCGDKYSCTKCGYHDSLLYAMRKHVLVHHSETLLKKYYGIRSATDANKQGGTSSSSTAAADKRVGSQSKFFCRSCQMPAETTEHLLYHLLSSDKHPEVNVQISPMLVEHMMKGNGTNARVSTLAPRAMQQVVSMVSNKTTSKDAPRPTPPNGKPVPPPQGTVLLAAAPQATALVCATAGGQQILLANPNAAATAAGALPGQPYQLLLQPGGMQPRQVVQMVPRVTFQPNVQPKVNNNQTNQPVMLTQVKGAAGAAIGTNQSLMFSQVNAAQPVMAAGGLLSSPNVRLVPTGNQVNGVPTYTLVAVQNAVTNINLVTIPQQPGQTPAVVQQKGSSAPTCKDNSESKQLVTKSQYLVRTDCGFVRCLRCKTLLSDKGVFQHLLHGLQCLFCPLIFYSLKQLLAHNEATHSLKDPENRRRAREEYRLETTEDGRLSVPSFSMKTTLPKDLLGCKKLELALITESRANVVLYLHLSEEPGGKPPPAGALPPGGCPFCSAKPPTPSLYEQHLRGRHHVLPTIHAILKTPAFKCVFCLGVYTDKLSGRTISIHVQRCRCAPRAIKEVERMLNPDPQSSAEASEGGSVSTGGRSNGRGGGVSSTTLLLEPPAGLELRPPAERKYFLGQYFNKRPYPSRKETELLASRLKLSRPDVTKYLENKRRGCIQDCHSLRFRVLLGFDTTRMQALKVDMGLQPAATGGTSSGLQIKTEESTTKTAVVKAEPDSPEPCSSETEPGKTPDQLSAGKKCPDSTSEQDTPKPIRIKTETDREQEKPLQNGSCPD